MPKFTYNDIVRVRSGMDLTARRERGWVVGVFEDRPEHYFKKFPPGVVYTVEFEDGTSTEAHENALELDSAHDDLPERARSQD